MKVFVPSDVPSSYHYIRVNQGYFDLFNSSNPRGNVTYYRIYYDYNDFSYLTYSQNFGDYSTSNFPSVELTNNILDAHRPDIPFICIFILVIGFIFLLNLITSLIKKGGSLGGLL